MVVPTEKPILAITPPPQTGILDSLENIELDLDVHCTNPLKGSRNLLKEILHTGKFKLHALVVYRF